MGYRIHYAVRDGMLQAAVSGKTLARGASHADWIARDIAAQAGEETVNRVLIDLRGLADRLGFLGSLSMVRGERSVGGYRVAVVDTIDNDAYYALHEVAALARGCVLRCFTSVADAARWLRSTPAQD
jgi:hypothetical protein